MPPSDGAHRTRTTALAAGWGWRAALLVLGVALVGASVALQPPANPASETAARASAGVAVTNALGSI